VGTKTEERFNVIFDKVSKKYRSRVDIQGCIYSDKLDLNYKFIPNGIEKPYHMQVLEKCLLLY